MSEDCRAHEGTNVRMSSAKDTHVGLPKSAPLGDVWGAHAGCLLIGACVPHTQGHARLRGLERAQAFTMRLSCNHWGPLLALLRGLLPILHEIWSAFLGRDTFPHSNPRALIALLLPILFQHLGELPQ